MIRQYTEQDIEDINHWYNLRGELRLPRDLFPEFGFVEPGVAAVFLYRTDAGFAFLENLITNPDAGLYPRIEAVKRVIDAGIEKAKALGVPRVLFLTEKSSVEAYMKRTFGFEFRKRYNLYQKEL